MQTPIAEAKYGLRTVLLEDSSGDTRDNGDHGGWYAVR